MILLYLCKFKVRIIPAIKDQLQQLYHSKNTKADKKGTFREKRTKLRQQEGLSAVQKILQSKKAMESKDNENE